MIINNTQCVRIIVKAKTFDKWGLIPMIKIQTPTID